MLIVQAGLGEAEAWVVSCGAQQDTAGGWQRGHVWLPDLHPSYSRTSGSSHPRPVCSQPSCCGTCVVESV